ncbi:peptide chain release factor N(5)-glutamine methyltransferase [Thioalkalivibrio versutus]|uniref:peptide chain release factor N(5)-glutamine methyltransferase n=1 Tax=Thioalkalivibrio versutus TaxID=106634 RepID=UPI00036124C1|nr:peptide chain release factor N(5)-glutamine methyltransferase [Thioalkalivibrio versutus]OOC48092.1 protein-(glutamine-N5) methyltransferase, release factor-specific [Thioalkalivibrio versutus]
MEAPPTLDTLLQGLRTRLQDAGIETPGLEARMLLGAATGRDTAQLIAHGTDPATPEQASRVDVLCRRRCAGEPMAHILGRRSFWTLELGVSPACLIPRPETELLVEHALTAINACSRAHPRVLDLGTGTGAIILALKAERAAIEAVASDHSLDALRQARANADALGLDVAFLQGSWLAPLKPRDTFDVIVSNPPYIALDDPHLTRGDLRFEPHSALVAADVGLADLRTIIQTAGEHLAPSGHLLLEHGFDQACAVRAMLEDAGYTAIRSHIDTAGHERITEGLLAPEGPA